MKRWTSPLSVVLILGAAALAIFAGVGHPSESDGLEQIALRPSPRIGLNFIRFFWSESRDGRLNTTTPYLQPDSIFRDFADLGV